MAVLNRDQAFFLNILRDYLNGEKTVPPENPNWKLICKLASIHNLGGIFFVQCAPLIQDPELLRQLNTAFGAAVSHWANLREDYSTLKAALSEQGIRFIPVKGVVLASYYPNPELRTMGDIDILVHPVDRERIRDCLQPRGFVNTKWSQYEWDYCRNHSVFELQADLLNPGSQDGKKIIDYFNSFWSRADFREGCEGLLDPEFHFLYLVEHLGKHLRWRGVGFRMFFDLAVWMRRSGIPMDWNRIRQEAEEIGFDRFLLCCLALTERWFGVRSPFGTDCLEDELFESLTEKIFADGVFGFDNEINYIQAVEKERHNSRLPLPLLKLKAAGKLLFPSYRSLTTSVKYAYLRGRPYLLPYAWIRRAVSGRKSMGRAELNAVLAADQEALEARLAQMKKLGLSN